MINGLVERGGGAWRMNGLAERGDGVWRINRRVGRLFGRMNGVVNGFLGGSGRSMNGVVVLMDESKHSGSSRNPYILV